MNKLFTKVATLSIGLAMAIGVGVAVGSNKESSKVDAAYSGTSPWSYTFKSGDLATTGSTKTFNSVSWTWTTATTISWDGSTSKGFQIGSGNNPQKSDWTISAPISDFGNNKAIKSISVGIATAKSGGIAWHIKAGENDGTGSTGTAGATTSVTTKTANYSTAVSSGSVSITLNSNNVSKAIYIHDISVTFESASSGTPTETSITAAGGKTTLNPSLSPKDTVQLSASVTYNSGASTISSPSITWTSSDTNVATVSGTTDTATVTAAGRGQTTITASYAGNSTYSASSATIVIYCYDYSTSFNVTSFADAKAAAVAAGSSEVGPYFIVGHIKSITNTQYGNGVLANTSASEDLTIYGMYDVNGNKGSSMANPAEPIANDVVVLEGKVLMYNSTTFEIKDAVVRQLNGTVYNYPKAVESIEVETEPDDVEYDAGELFDPSGLVITVSYNDNTSEPISYLGNEEEFTFTPDLETALTTSDTEVTIEYGGKSTTQSIKVNAVPAVISVTVSPSSASVNIGNTTTLTATVDVEGGASENVTWSSSSDAIATVTPGGVVTGVTAGTATITATSTFNNQKSGSATITVVDPDDVPAGRYSLVKNANDLKDGDWIVITNTDASYGMGEQGSNKYRTQVALTLTGSDIEISSTKNTTLKALKITVKNNHFEMLSDEGYLYANSGTSNDIGKRATNSDANGEWVFTIDATSGDTTCIAQGSNARKSLRYNSANSRFSCYAVSNTMQDIHVYKKLPDTKAVSLSSDKEILTYIGATATLTAKAYSDSGKTKEIAGLTNADFDFTSGDTSVLTVDASGVVTAVAGGSTTITVSRSNCEASVTIKVVYVTVDLVDSSTNVEAGDSGTFTFSWSDNSLKPSSYTAQWSSSNEDAIVLVDEEEGTFLAGSAGESSSITVTVIDSELNEYTASRTFSTVSSIVAPTHISVTESSGVIAYVGTNANLHITVLGDGDVPATNQNVICVSSKTNVLKVNNSGVITPIGKGIATVTITDEGGLCEPVVISVRVRTPVLGEAKIMGVLTAPSSPDTSEDISEHFETKNSYSAPSSVTQTNGYNDRSGYFRIAAGSSAGSISVEYSSLKISKIVVVGKRYGSNKADPTVEGATADKEFASDDTTVTFTFESPVNEFALLASSGNQFCCKSITVYSEKQDDSLTANAQACYAFEEQWMHLDDYDPGLHEGVDGNNWCKDSEHNYYQKDDTKDGAKKAFNALTSEQKAMLMTNESFSDAWARLQAWATANGDTLNGNNELVEASKFALSIFGSESQTASTVIIVIISLVGVASIGGYFLFRKKKEY